MNLQEILLETAKPGQTLYRGVTGLENERMVLSNGLIPTSLPDFSNTDDGNDYANQVTGKGVTQPCFNTCIPETQKAEFKTAHHRYGKTVEVIRFYAGITGVCFAFGTQPLQIIPFAVVFRFRIKKE